MRLAYHGIMHCAVWKWIRDWCEEIDDSELPETPTQVLRWLIWKSAEFVEHEPPYGNFVVENGVDYWGDPLSGFATTMCQTGQRLYNEGLQEIMTWKNMKIILEFYLTDCTDYIERINSLGWTPHQINTFFGLGMDYHYVQHSLSDEEINHELIWSRYLTSDKIWFYDDEPQWPSCEPLPASGGWCVNTNNAWAFTIKINTGLRNPNQSDDELDGQTANEDDAENQTDVESEGQSDEEETTTSTELTEEERKKNDALRKIQEIIDEVHEDLGDGLYLNLMNCLKTEYVVSS